MKCRGKDGIAGVRERSKKEQVNSGSQRDIITTYLLFVLSNGF